MSTAPIPSPADSAMEVYEDILPQTAQPPLSNDSHPSSQTPAPSDATPIPKGSSENKPTGRKRHHDEEDDAPAPDPKRAISNSRTVVTNNRDATPPAEQSSDPEDGTIPWWHVDPADSLTEEQPRDGDDPFDAKGRVVVPTKEGRFAIHGITHKELFALVGKQTRASWNEEPEPKVIVYIPGDKYRRDPSTTTDIIQAAVTRIIEYEKFMVIPCTPDNPKTIDPYALYVPTLVCCLKPYHKTALLDFPLFSTEMGTIATLPYNFGPTRFLCTLGDTNLKNIDEHKAVIRTQIVETILRTGSQAYRKINENFDHIPHDHISSATARTTYIANSIIIEGYNITVKQNNNKLDKPRFNVYAYPPSFNSKKHQDWIDLFGRMSITTRYGPAYVLEQFYCRHCSGRTHPTGLCQYPTLDGFRDTEFPDTGDQSNSSNPQNRGSSFRGRGGHGGHGNRGGKRGRGLTRY